MTENNPSKANDVELELTIGDLFFAKKLTKETATTPPEYDTDVTRIPNIKKIAFKGNGKSTDIYASGKKFGTIAQETSIEVTHTHIGMPVAVLDAMKDIIASHGVEFGTTDAKSLAEFAIGFDTILSNGVHDGMWLPSCTLDPAQNDTHETSEDGFKEVNPELTYNAGGLRNSNVYYARYNSARDSADISIDDFFKQVIYSPEQLEEVAGSTTAAPASTSTAVTGVTASPTTASVEVGKTTTIASVIAPTTATNKAVTYKSSDDTIATVDASGKVTGVKEGAATVTITTTDGAKTATAAITVTAAA